MAISAPNITRSLVGPRAWRITSSRPARSFCSSPLWYISRMMSRAADELAVHVELRDRRPVGELLDALADVGVLQHVDGEDVLDARRP